MAEAGVNGTSTQEAHQQFHTKVFKELNQRLQKMLEDYRAEVIAGGGKGSCFTQELHHWCAHMIGILEMTMQVNGMDPHDVAADRMAAFYQGAQQALGSLDEETALAYKARLEALLQHPDEDRAGHSHGHIRRAPREPLTVRRRLRRR